jgi:hypothetical protein
MIPCKFEGIPYPETGQDMLTFKQWDNDPKQTGTMREIQNFSSLIESLPQYPSVN